VNDGHEKNPDLELPLNLRGMDASRGAIPGVGHRSTGATAALTKYPTAMRLGEGEAEGRARAACAPDAPREGPPIPTLGAPTPTAHSSTHRS
jgi:hypothetical protein